MARCTEYNIFGDTWQVDGSILYENLSPATLVDIGSQIQNDMLPLVPSNDPAQIFAWYRCFTRVTALDESIVPVFPGAVPRYKLGRFTPCNSDCFYEVQFINYSLQTYPIMYLITGNASYPENVAFEACTTPSDQFSVRGMNLNFFAINGGDWISANSVLIDPEVGVEIDMVVYYAGYVQANSFDFGTDSYRLLNW